MNATDHGTGSGERGWHEEDCSKLEKNDEENMTEVLQEHDRRILKNKIPDSEDRAA